MILKEGNLEIDFTNSPAVLFDDQDKNSLTYHDIPQMPKVDFIAEKGNEIFFIEVKDPAKIKDTNPEDYQNFLKKISENKMTKSLIDKYLYSFAYRWAENKLNKQCSYICLITLSDQEIIPLQEELDRAFKLIIGSKSKRWLNHPLRSCIVMNMATWNSVFDTWKLMRVG